MLHACKASGQLSSGNSVWRWLQDHTGSWEVRSQCRWKLAALSALNVSSEG